MHQHEQDHHRGAATPTPPASCPQLLQRMVRFDSVNSVIAHRPDSELPLALWLEATAKGMGLSTQRLPISGQSFNLLVSAPPASTSASSAFWLLESHMDTVSVAGMSIDPFGGDIAGGRLFGRGASDTKGSGAAMLWALWQYSRQEQRPNDAAVVFVCGEEHQKTGAVAFAQKQLPTLPRRPSAMVVGEPTMLAPVVAHNGVVRWAIHTHGLAAHSSNPANGRSAISMMLRVVAALEERYAPALTACHELTGKAQCSVNLIRGGAQINIIPDQCTIEVDRRVAPGEDASQVLPAVEQVLAQVRQENPGLDVTQDQPYIDPALDPRGAEKVIAAVAAALNTLGLPSQALGAPYGTDASTYREVGVPSLVLGPGDIRQAHTHDEWIALEQLERGVAVYQAILNSRMSD